MLYEDSTTLNNMNFDVIVGNLVWNQNRDKLTNDKEKTLLIYKMNQLKLNKVDLFLDKCSMRELI